MDAYYTPTEIASAVVGAISARPKVVADFTCGTGELLQAARARWPNAQVIGTDINPGTITEVAKLMPEWNVAKCDFLSARARQRCEVLREWGGRIDAAVLNPPFSGRGGSVHEVRCADRIICCSKALAVVLTAVEYVRSGGIIAAVLPAGCLLSDKDRDAWAQLRRVANVRVTRRYGRERFAACAASTVLVVITLRSAVAASSRKRTRERVDTPLAVEVVRGTYQMHAPPGAGPLLPVVHTTDLQRGGVLSSTRLAGARWRVVQGPAVLLPRVGEPNMAKIAVYAAPRRRVISDCVIALTCRSVAHAREVQVELQQRWQTVARAYSGTCAKYITVERLRAVLRQMNSTASARMVQKTA